MNIPLILHTCDKYNWLWKGWEYYFKKFWKYDNEIIFVNETITEIPDNCKHFPTGSGQWSDRLIKALDNIQSDYVIYMQEDFWPIKEPPNIESLFNILKKENLDAIRICEPSIYYSLIDTEYENIKQFLLNSDYLITHQFSIWNKRFFRKSLVSNETPWDHEIKGTERLKFTPCKIYIYEDKWYDPVCRHGKLTPFGTELQGKIND